MDTAIYRKRKNMYVAEMSRIRERHFQYFLRIKKYFECPDCHHHVYFRFYTKHGHTDCFYHEKGHYKCNLKANFFISDSYKEREEKEVRMILRPAELSK